MRAQVLVLVCLAGCVGEAPPSLDPEPRPGVDPAQIQAWLVAGGYEGWAAESDVIPSSEFGAARTFFSPELVSSLAEGVGEHPLGATAVREYYGPDFTTLTGYAYLTRAREGEGAGSWFWFETWALEASASPQVAAFGVETCAGCHTTGRDFIQTQWPLR